MATLQDRALDVLDRNTKQGKGYFYVAPSNRKYPHQWSWDSSFHAIVNCRLGRPELARKEIRTLLAQLLPDGTLPHIIFHSPSLDSLVNRALRFYWPDSRRSPLVQPPVVALAVGEIWRTTEDQGFLEQVLPNLSKHFDWLHTRRRFGDSPLVSIFSPWESGLDHKPAFDPLLGRLAKLPLGRYIALYMAEMRLARHHYDAKEIERRGYFNVREVLFNTVYALGMEALSSMFRVLGDFETAERFRKRHLEVEAVILEECYDPDSGLYFDIDVRTGGQLREPGISSLMPIALATIPKDRIDRIVSHLTDPNEFWLKFPIPSVPRSSPHFRPGSRTYLWRGPTWLNTNWFIAGGLKRHGDRELAEEIGRSSRALVQRSGFREYYNPLTGAGGGEKDFGWSTLAVVT